MREVCLEALQREGLRADAAEALSYLCQFNPWVATDEFVDALVAHIYSDDGAPVVYFRPCGHPLTSARYKHLAIAIHRLAANDAAAAVLLKRGADGALRHLAPRADAAGEAASMAITRLSEWGDVLSA